MIAASVDLFDFVAFSHLQRRLGWPLQVESGSLCGVQCQIPCESFRLGQGAEDCVLAAEILQIHLSSAVQSIDVQVLGCLCSLNESCPDPSFLSGRGPRPISDRSALIQGACFSCRSYIFEHLHSGPFAWLTKLECNRALHVGCGTPRFEVRAIRDAGDCQDEGAEDYQVPKRHIGGSGVSTCVVSALATCGPDLETDGSIAACHRSSHDNPFPIRV